MTLHQYMAQRRWWETGLILLLLLIGFGANVAVELIDIGRHGRNATALVPVITEGSSHLGLLVCIPLILWFDRHYPIGGPQRLRNLGAHAAFSVVF